MFDIVFTNCRVIDGTGSPWRGEEVGIKNGRIVKVGKILTGYKDEWGEIAEEIVDCNDHYLVPGFIDIHTHSDTSLMYMPINESRILQGVTTEVAGNCGISAVPVSDNEEKRNLLKDYVGDLEYSWRSMDEYLRHITLSRPSTNFCMVVGHGSLRVAAMGFDDREPTEKEMDIMKGLLHESLQDGAYGMSSGLIYPPGVFSKTEEMKELCKILPKYGAYYCTHMRNEGAKLIEAVEEALEVARDTEVPLQISHHKALRRENWRNLCYKSTALIEAAREEGLDVLCDQYPYIATATTLDCNIPDWAFEGGVEKMLERLQKPGARSKMKAELKELYKDRWPVICVSYTQNPDYEWTVGKSIAQIAEEMGKEPEDACFDLILYNQSRVGQIGYAMCEEDVEYIMQKPYVMTGSDGEAFTEDYMEGKPHPRNSGTFPRVIAHYCRDRKLFSLEEAIRKMTSMPAGRIGLEDRGLIKKGYAADIVIFDFDKIEDTPTFEHPEPGCKGIDRVYVNGVLTAKNGLHTLARAGEVLRRGR